MSERKTQATAIRPYQEADFATLDDIRARAFAPIFRSLRSLVGPEVAAAAFAGAEDEQAELLRSICSPDSADQVFVATLEGMVVGFVSVSLDQGRKVGEIGLNAVAPAYSGRGIGTQLYLFALDEMRRAGMTIAAVSTGADPSHAAARRAYEKVGFSRTAPTQWMYASLPSDD